MAERPSSRGIFLCETVITDRDTGAVSLINCFTRREFANFPTEPMRCVLFAVLSNGFGTIQLEVMIDDEAETRLFERSRRARFSDRLQETRFTLTFHGLVFPAPGKYEVLLGADGEIAGRLILDVSQQEDRQ